MLRPRTRLSAALVALLAGSALATGVGSPAGAQPGGDQPAKDNHDAAVRALAHHRHISTGKADKQLTAEQHAADLGTRLQQQVGPESAGHYVDAESRPVVNVTSDAAAETVRSGGANARVVARSLVQLQTVKTDLDRLARTDGAGKVQSWGVDVAHNQVRVITTAGADDDKTRDFLAMIGSDPAVTVTSTKARMLTMDELYGGQQLDSADAECSRGFNARDTSGNAVLLTAGHCAQGYTTFSADGVEIGTTTNFTFPGSGDYAEAPITNAYWASPATAGASGTDQRISGSDQAISGTAQATVGTAICKSGRSTGWSCGTVRTIDNTVNYDNGDGSSSTVTGLIETSACAEVGDSGGANLSGSRAIGMTSGGAGYDDDGNPLTPPVCGQHVGRSNVTFVQPIDQPLRAYGLSLITDDEHTDEDGH